MTNEQDALMRKNYGQERTSCCPKATCASTPCFGRSAFIHADSSRFSVCSICEHGSHYLITTTQCVAMKHIEELIADGGTVSVGALWPHECVATAADEHNSLAMLVRRDGETLAALLKRLDAAIAKAYDDGDFTDEVNSAST
jgi:hypothetical protein